MISLSHMISEIPANLYLYASIEVQDRAILKSALAAELTP